MKIKAFAAATALAVVMAGGAAASTVDVTYQNSGNVFGTNGKATVTLSGTSVPSSPQGVNAGGFALKGEPLGDFVAWCLDLATTMKNNITYTITGNPFTGNLLSAAQKGNIQALFNTAYKTLDLTSNTESAGFQLALWELAYETGGTLNVGNGSFKASGHAGAVNFANGLLAGLGGNTTQSYSLTFLESGKSQNLVTASPIPLPAAGFLMLGALGGLGLVARRRRKAA